MMRLLLPRLAAGLLLVCLSLPATAADVPIGPVIPPDAAGWLPPGSAEGQMYGADGLLIDALLFHAGLWTDERRANDHALKPSTFDIRTGLRLAVAPHWSIVSLPVEARIVDRLALRLTVPVVRHRAVQRVDGTAYGATRYGLGDLSFEGSWRFDVGSFALIPGLALKFPTGDDGASLYNRTLDGRIRVPLGSGSWDAAAFLRTAWRHPYGRLSGSFTFRYNGPAEIEGEGGRPAITITQGQHLHLQLGAEFNPLWEDVWFGVSTAWFMATPATVHGRSAGTGVQVFEAGLSVVWQITRDIRLDAAFRMPFSIFYDSLVDNDPAGDWMVVLGLQFVL